MLRNSNIDLKLSEPYTHIDLGLTSEEIDSLDKLSITHFNEKVFYGQLNNLLNDIETYLISLANSLEVAKNAAKIISAIINQVIAAYKETTAFVILRPTAAAHNFFDTPRWHLDGNFFEAPTVREHKVVMTLKGDNMGTLFYKADSGDRTKVQKSGEEVGKNFENEPVIRQVLADQLNDVNKIDPTPKHYATRFATGPEGAVHAEPKMIGPRLFLSIMPTTQEKIEEYKAAQEKAKQPSMK